LSSRHHLRIFASAPRWYGQARVARPLGSRPSRRGLGAPEPFGQGERAWHYSYGRTSLGASGCRFVADRGLGVGTAAFD
jgi:hypothetical protein